MTSIEFFQNSKFFKVSEFDSPNIPDSGYKMDTNFLQKLEVARMLANVPFIVNRGFSSEKHNKEVGGISGSDHTTGTSVDLKCLDSKTRFLIVVSLITAGFNQIGVYNSHIHVHQNPKKPDRILFIGSYH